MKNNAQKEYYWRLPESSNEIRSRKDREKRIQFLRKAWQDRSLTIDSSQLAEKIINFEREIESVLPATPAQK